MQCNDIQEMLSAYIDGVLDENEAAVVEEHIRICSFCSHELAALRETVKLLNSLGEVSPPAEFRSKLMQRVEAIPQEDAKGTSLVEGPGLTGMRRWVRGINKYLVAAVLMIGLGLGTGLYKLGVSSGFQTFDLALNSKAPAAINTQLAGSQSKQAASGSEPANTALNAPLAKDSANTELGETSLTKPKDKGSTGSTPKLAQKGARVTAQEPAQVQVTMADSPPATDNSVRNPAGASVEKQVQYSALQTADIVKSPEPQVVQNGSLVIEVANFQAVAAKIPEMTRQVDGFVSNSTEKLVQSATGYFTLKVPARNLEGFLSELGHLGKVTQRQIQGTVVANDLKNVDESAGYSTVELEVKAVYSVSQDKALSQGASTQSAEAKSGGVPSTVAGWTLPGALLAAGIGCAAYYFYLRWRKN